MLVSICLCLIHVAVHCTITLPVINGKCEVSDNKDDGRHAVYCNGIKRMLLYYYYKRLRRDDATGRKSD